MRNLQEVKKELEQKANKSIDLLELIKNGLHIQLSVFPKFNKYVIFENDRIIYKSKDLELAIKEYWKLIGEEYE